LISAVKHPGQQLLLVVALPIHEWIVATRREAVLVDIAEIRRARRLSRRRHSVRTSTANVAVPRLNRGHGKASA
jgi:hypothetical protein